MKKVIVYKGISIEYVSGTNWAYIGNRIFKSVLGAKQAITRNENKSIGDK